MPGGKVKGNKRQSLAATNRPVADEAASLYPADDKAKGLEGSDQVQEKWSMEVTPPVVKRPVQEKPYGVPVGAICPGWNEK